MEMSAAHSEQLEDQETLENTKGPSHWEQSPPQLEPEQSPILELHCELIYYNGRTRGIPVGWGESKSSCIVHTPCRRNQSLARGIAQNSTQGRVAIVEGQVGSHGALVKADVGNREASGSPGQRGVLVGPGDAALIDRAARRSRAE